MWFICISNLEDGILRENSTNVTVVNYQQWLSQFKDFVKYQQCLSNFDHNCQTSKTFVKYWQHLSNIDNDCQLLAMIAKYQQHLSNKDDCRILTRIPEYRKPEKFVCTGIPFPRIVLVLQSLQSCMTIVLSKGLCVPISSYFQSEKLFYLTSQLFTPINLSDQVLFYKISCHNILQHSSAAKAEKSFLLFHFML